MKQSKNKQVVIGESTEKNIYLQDIEQETQAFILQNNPQLDVYKRQAWLRASEDGSGQVTEVKVLKGIQWLYAFFTWLLIGVAAYILLGFVNDAQQPLDAITFSVSATGMLLMIKRYQSQFVFWLLGNIFSILLWFRAGTHAGGDYAIFVMYCMYTFNSIFGMFNWLKIKNKMEKNR